MQQALILSTYCLPYIFRVSLLTSNEQQSSFKKISVPFNKRLVVECHVGRRVKDEHEKWVELIYQNFISLRTEAHGFPHTPAQSNFRLHKQTAEVVTGERYQRKLHEKGQNMSNRALRKLQGKSDIVIPELKDDSSEDNAPDPAVKPSSKKCKSRNLVTNPFELVNSHWLCSVVDVFNLCFTPYTRYSKVKTNRSANKKIRSGYFV